VNDRLSTARHAAAAGVELLQTDYQNDAAVTDCCGKDLKTAADVAAQTRILEILQATGIPVLAEEGPQRDADLNSPLWVVDPLDGTLNFSRGFRMAAVSIAYWDLGQPLLGVVHEISGNRIYCGQVGKGAWMNGQQLCVSKVVDVAQAILATGFPSARSYDTADLLRFVCSVQRYKKIRMLGSAAIMLAEVASGHFDVYEEEDIYLWDVAAGLALVVAAGGRYELRTGSGPYKYHVRAWNGLC